MPAFKWYTNVTRDTVHLLDEIQNTKKINTQELKKRKFEKEVREVGWVVLIFISHFPKHLSTGGKR